MIYTNNNRVSLKKNREEKIKIKILKKTIDKEVYMIYNKLQYTYILHMYIHLLLYIYRILSRLQGPAAKWQRSHKRQSRR